MFVWFPAFSDLGRKVGAWMTDGNRDKVDAIAIFERAANRRFETLGLGKKTVRIRIEPYVRNARFLPQISHRFRAHRNCVRVRRHRSVVFLQSLVQNIVDGNRQMELTRLTIDLLVFARLKDGERNRFGF